MKLRTLFVSTLLALALAAPAIALEDPSVVQRADATVERISGDLAKYIGEIDRAIAMAKEGQYGKLARGSEARLTEARQVIGNLLQNVSDPRELKPDQRIALFNAHEEINAIINKQDKSRVVCTRERKTGSRLSTTECLTVGEREERARVAQAGTNAFQRAVCTPGEGNSCTQ
jgi:hypothetical protein